MAVILITAITYAATTPYRAQQALSRALRDGDEATLAALVDAHALRSDLRLQLEATLAAGASTGFLAPRRDDADTAALQRRVEAVADRLAAPAMLRRLIAPELAGSHAVGDPLADARARLQGTREFRLTLNATAPAPAAAAHAASELVLVRSGLTWRLARLTVPPELLLAEEERLREEAREQRRQALQDEIDALQAEAELAARDALRRQWQQRARALVRQQRSRQVPQTAGN